MSKKFPTGLYKCATCKEVCAEPEALEAVKKSREELLDSLKETVIYLKQYVEDDGGPDSVYEVLTEAEHAIVKAEGVK